MTELHLNDQQIQEYLDNRTNPDDSAYRHLESCTTCRESLEMYRELCSRLGSTEQPILSPDFADRTMRRIGRNERLPVRSQSVWQRPLVVVGGCSLFLAVAILATVSLAPGPLQKAMAFSEASLLSIGSSIMGAIRPLFTEFNMKPLIVLFSIITLIGTALLDRIIIKYRRTRRLISLMV
jgi:hypothetical protein